MSTTQDTQNEENELPRETEALINALHRKTNYQADRIDELEQTIEDLRKELREVER